MFFGKHRKLAKMIDVFAETWGAAQALDAMLAESEIPKVWAPYYAIMYGATDSLAQSIGADVDTTKRALLLHLKQYSNGAEVFDRIADTINDPMLRPWIIEAGGAVHAMRTRVKDPTQALLPLAERYRLAAA